MLWMHPNDRLSRLPSEYFRENAHVTFQDDRAAFQMAGLRNVERMMWANDFPHGDSPWPWSRSVIEEHTAGMPPSSIDRIVHDDGAEPYRLASRRSPASPAIAREFS